jgi:hypothetical protein
MANVNFEIRRVEARAAVFVGRRRAGPLCALPGERRHLTGT